MPKRSADAPDPAFVLLHTGKTGGTALRAMLANAPAGSGACRIKMLRHKGCLAAAATRLPTAALGFFVRDPVDRAVSGFLSRLRFGMPRYNTPWDEGETKVFTRFPTPEALGLALAANLSEAQAAMQQVLHLRMDYTHFIGAPQTLATHAARIFFIGDLATYDADIIRLKRLTGLPADLHPPTDATAAHRNPDPALAILTPTAQAGWEQALQTDRANYTACTALREKQLAAEARS